MRYKYLSNNIMEEDGLEHFLFLDLEILGNYFMETL